MSEFHDDIAELDEAGAALQEGSESAPAAPGSLLIGAENIAQAVANRAVIFLAGMESDYHALSRYDLPCATTEGGFAAWTKETAPELAAGFAGADVVVVPGEYANRSQSVCAALKKAGAKVRLVTLGDAWSFQEWAGYETDPAEALYTLAEKMEPWAGYRSQFGAVPWDRIEESGASYEWLIKGLIARGELAMLAGPSQSGKSFLAIDLAMSVARGVPWCGQRVAHGGVIYCAGESAYGVRRLRLPAYRQFHGCGKDAIDFVMMSRAVDLCSDDITTALIEEAKHWQSEFTNPLQLIVIDTLSSSIVGADENLARDITPVLGRCARIRDALGCAVLLVHHMNALGEKPRGSTALMANVESVILCRLDESRRDADNRKIREIKLAKQKDGEAERSWRFVLPAVTIGTDEDGDKVTSCVVQEPNMGLLQEDEPQQTGKGPRLADRPMNYLKAIKAAIDEHGVKASEAKVALPPDHLVVHKKHVAEEYARRWQGEESDEKKREQNMRAARMRLGEKLLAGNWIGSSSPYLWLTGKGEGRVTPRSENVAQNDENVTGSQGSVTQSDQAVTNDDAEDLTWLG